MFLNKLKIITNIVTYGFTDLLKNISLQDLNEIINSLFQICYTKLQLPDNIGIEFFKSLTNFIINDFVYHT